jgi:hypothetical protein
MESKKRNNKITSEELLREAVRYFINKLNTLFKK